MTNLPEFQSYGEYSSDNYGVNTLQFIMPGITIYFSYQTVVAYYTPADGRVVSENIWGTTTGKHLNWIDPDHSIRTPRLMFEAKLEAALTTC